MARPQGLPSPLSGRRDAITWSPALTPASTLTLRLTLTPSRDLAGLTGPWAPCYLFSECRRRRQVLRPPPALRVGAAPVVRGRKGKEGEGSQPRRQQEREKQAESGRPFLFPLSFHRPVLCGFHGNLGEIWRVAGPSLCLSPCSLVAQRGGGGGRRKVNVRVKQLLKVHIKFWRNLIIFDGTFQKKEITMEEFI